MGLRYDTEEGKAPSIVYSVLQGIHAFPITSLQSTCTTVKINKKDSYRWQTRAMQKPAKIAPIRRVYNVVADNTGLSSCV